MNVTPAKRIETPSRLASNLVYSSDGRRLFALSTDGDLISAHVGRNPGEVVAPAETVRRVAEGAVVAAGWLEDRLATIALVDGDLELSHGDYGVDFNPSRPTRAPLQGSDLRVTPGRRLDPYVRWWREVVPEEGLLGPITLLRDDDDRLFSVEAWRSDLRGVVLIGDQVAGLASSDERRCTAFVGKPAPSKVKRGRIASWLARRRRVAPSASPTAIYLLHRRAHFPIPARVLSGTGPFHAFVGSPCRASDPRDSSLDDFGLWAVETNPGVWTIASVDTTTVVEVAPTDSVAGVVGIGPGDGAALLLREAGDQELSLRTPRGRQICLRAPAPIEQIAVSPADPLLAYVSAGELFFAWFDGW